MRGITTKSILSGLVLFCLSSQFIFSQVSQNDLSGQVNVISTAVPFMTIQPDSRVGGMGEAGVATDPDFNSMAINPAKYAFLDADFGISGSFTPWLRQLVNDINLYYLTGFYRIDKMQTVSGSLRYFSLGEILFKDNLDDNGYTVKPSEFAFDAAYSRMLSKKFSGSVAFRYIHSDLSGGTNDQLQPGNSFASDVSFYFTTPMKLGKQKSNVSAGINISNIGSKISYDGTNKQFIPTNLKLGGALKTDIDNYNSITFALDFNKLLVPTPDTIASDQSFSEAYKDVSVISGMFQSFGDAPGGFKEELHEINISAGIEYWYNKQFAIRAGYFHEHETKGNRKYMTAGAGIKFNVFTIDASYIIPVVSNNPLANTIRFSLSYNFTEM